jgi:hypothetical protein
MKYKERTKTKGALKTPAVIEEHAFLAGVKYIDRKDINEEIFDTEDAVADNAKLISLLLSITSRLYEIVPDTQKDQLSADDRAIIEYAFNQFKNVSTRADRQFQVEGTDLIDKLYKRQNYVGEVIDPGITGKII